MQRINALNADQHQILQLKNEKITKTKKFVFVTNLINIAYVVFFIEHTA
jgi:hypothetical protein